MATNRVFRSVLLAAGVLLMAACASQPASTTGSLDEKYFQREANNYQKFQHEGQTVYCQNESQAGSLIPYKWCISESALRQRVENFRRNRNSVTRGGPPYVATVPGGSGT
jgi:outer membrane biogenesis lipoprotein LolB